MSIQALELWQEKTTNSKDEWREEWPTSQSVSSFSVCVRMTLFAMMGGFFPQMFCLIFARKQLWTKSGEQICQFLLHLPIWGTNLTSATAAQLNVSDGVQPYELISQVNFLTQMD